MKRGKNKMWIPLTALLAVALFACGKDDRWNRGRFGLQGFFISDVSPKDGEQVMGVGSAVRLTFSEAVDERSLESGFSLKENCGAQTTAVQGRFDYQNQGTLAIFRPNGTTGLRDNCVYSLDIYSSVISKTSGSRLITPLTGYQFGFNNGTVSIPGTPPYVTSLYPEPGTYWIGDISYFQVIFSEPLQDVSAQGMSLRATDVFGLSPGSLIPLEAQTAVYGNSKIWYLYPQTVLGMGEYELCFDNLVDYDNEISGHKCYRYTLVQVL